MTRRGAQCRGIGLAPTRLPVPYGRDVEAVAPRELLLCQAQAFAGGADIDFGMVHMGRAATGDLTGCLWHKHPEGVEGGGLRYQVAR
jgi:hypothetical protein